MTKLEKEKEQERAEAIAKLRELLPPGSTVYTILRHVSRSGMQRSISAIAIVDGRPYELDYLLTRIGLGRRDDKRGGIIVQGAGMDMGFHLVYSLAHKLYPDLSLPGDPHPGYTLNREWL